MKIKNLKSKKSQKGLASTLNCDSRGVKNLRSSGDGFTLVELMVVMAIFGGLMAMGLFFDFTFYRGTSFNTDVDAFASILQRARAKSINNIEGSGHGVYIDSDSYVIFQGDSYATRIPAQDQIISRNPGLTFTGTQEVAFTAISGGSDFEGDITITGSGKSAAISINHEGLINR